MRKNHRIFVPNEHSPSFLIIKVKKTSKFNKNPNILPNSKRKKKYEKLFAISTLIQFHFAGSKKFSRSFRVTEFTREINVFHKILLYICTYNVSDKKKIIKNFLNFIRFRLFHIEIFFLFSILVENTQRKTKLKFIRLFFIAFFLLKKR